MTCVGRLLFPCNYLSPTCANQVDFAKYFQLFSGWVALPLKPPETVRQTRYILYRSILFTVIFCPVYPVNIEWVIRRHESPRTPETARQTRHILYWSILFTVIIPRIGKAKSNKPYSPIYAGKMNSFCFPEVHGSGTYRAVSGKSLRFWGTNWGKPILLFDSCIRRCGRLFAYC